MKRVYSFLFFLHAFVGIGAMAGGLAAITNPQNPLGISVEVIKYSPFTNYLIPGIILSTVIGLGNLLSALILYFKLKFHAYICSVISWALVIWIVVQCIMMRDIALLHIIFFIIGLIQSVLSMIILFKQELFPTNMILKFYKRIGKEM